jgi:hypothetical protein
MANTSLSFVDNNSVVAGVYYKREFEKSKLRMGGGSWTITQSILDEKWNAVCFITDKCNYYIERTTAFEKGFFRTLDGQRKLVVPIKNWKTVSK